MIQFDRIGSWSRGWMAKPLRRLADQARRTCSAGASALRRPSLVRDVLEETRILMRDDRRDAAGGLALGSRPNGRTLRARRSQFKRVSSSERCEARGPEIAFAALRRAMLSRSSDNFSVSCRFSICRSSSRFKHSSCDMPRLPITHSRSQHHPETGTLPQLAVEPADI
jgi:hypothetical protein